MNNRIYDVLKWISVIVIPALVCLINTLGQTWGWQYTKEITITIGAIGVFIGAVIQISSAKYNKSQEVKEDENNNNNNN
jgi:hypothetical protein